MIYSLFVSGVVTLQIIAGVMLMKDMDTLNYAYGAKFSLLTIAFCNILDFSQGMAHI